MKTPYFVAAFAVLCAACARPPVQEIAAAQASINAAVQAGAEDYAADELRAAQDTLTAANTQVESKDYKGAKVSAVDAKAKADAASASVEANRSRMKAEAESMIAAERAAAAEIEGLLGKAKGKSVDAIRKEVADLRAHADAMQSDFDAGRYKQCLEKASMAAGLSSDIKARAEKAVAKTGKKR